RARDAELFAQPALRRQRLADLEHAIDDQAFDPLGNHVGQLAALLGIFDQHGYTYLVGPVWPKSNAVPAKAAQSPDIWTSRRQTSKVCVRKLVGPVVLSMDDGVVQA